MDLGQYTLPQLRELGTRIANEIEKRRSTGKATLLKRLERLAADHGLTLADVIGNAGGPQPKRLTSRPAPARKASPAPKYRHPNNRELAWSGRGRRPLWVDAWLAHGGALDALEIAAQKLARKPLPPAGARRPSASAETPSAERGEIASDVGDETTS